MSDPAEATDPGPRLRIDPDPELVSTARLFTAAAARQAGVGEAAIDDVKLAVNEACAAAIDGGSAAIEIDALPTDGRLTVTVTADGLRGDGDGAAAAGAPIGHLALVGSLFHDAELRPGSVRFSVSGG